MIILNLILKTIYRPFPHSTSVHMNNSTRARLGWTFSYIHCIFVRPNLASVPLFVGMWERSIAIVNKPLHLAPVRLQHMLLQLQKYFLKFIYKKGTELYVADTSCSYIDEKSDPDVDEQLTSCPLHQFLQHVWPNFRNLLLQILWGRNWPISFLMAGQQSLRVYPQRCSLTFQSEMMLSWTMESSWKAWVVVLQTLHKEYLGQLQEGHPGIGATKRRAREAMYWPSFILDIDSDIASCQPCNSASSSFVIITQRWQLVSSCHLSLKVQDLHLSFWNLNGVKSK